MSADWITPSKLRLYDLRQLFAQLNTSRTTTNWTIMMILTCSIYIALCKQVCVVTVPDSRTVYNLTNGLLLCKTLRMHKSPYFKLVQNIQRKVSNWQNTETKLLNIVLLHPGTNLYIKASTQHMYLYCMLWFDDYHNTMLSTSSQYLCPSSDKTENSELFSIYTTTTKSSSLLQNLMAFLLQLTEMGYCIRNERY